MSRILGIETSCDETGVAVVEDGRHILANKLASQASEHALFGGVVPEIASRRHTEVISQLTGEVLAECGDNIDAVAATYGPGLMGSLLVGVNFAKAFAYARKLPYVPVHHLEGHVFSVFLTDEPPAFPFLTLIVSGGHTCLVACRKPHEYELLGATRDDAVGESFDKVARLLELPYPGGPSIQKAAESGDPEAFMFPRGMGSDDSLDFSYSGLKTAVLYALRQENGWNVADIAASFQAAAIDLLLIKVKRALKETRLPALVAAGGVAANRLLRERLTAEIGEPVHVPPLSLCVDNGAMIAAAGASRWAHGYTAGLSSSACATIPLT